MSYCVNIKTKMQLRPHDIFDELVKRGEGIMITSDEFPCLKFGTMDEALRGIEISEKEDGLEVRICSCANAADYRLFVVAVDVLMDMTSSKAYSEEEEEVTNPYRTFNEQWIEQQMQSGWNVVTLMVRHSGTAIIMQGLFQPFCIGPHMLLSSRIDLYGDYEDNKPYYEKLSSYLVKVQWWLMNAKGTQSRMAIKNPDDSNEEPLEVSLITIKDNKVNPFDYVSYAPMLAFIDMDTDDCVIIRIENFGRILDKDNHLAGIDEWQVRTCCGEPTAEEIRELMSLAKRYVPENLHYHPTYPGSGYDNKQKTFIMKWNPTTSDTDMDMHIRSIRTILDEEIHRQIHEWKDAKMGDRFYMVKVMDDNTTGIVMSGVFGSQPYVPSTWNGRGRKTYHVDLKPNMILNPYTVPMLTTDELAKEIPNFMWRGGYSGCMLTEEQAKVLENIFAPYLESIAEKNDGINLCITRTY